MDTIPLNPGDANILTVDGKGNWFYLAILLYLTIDYSNYILILYIILEGAKENRENIKIYFLYGLFDIIY